MRAYRKVCDQRGWDVTIVLAVSPVNGLIFRAAYIGGMNAPRLNDFGTSVSRHPRGQYRAGDAPGLQPIPEHSRAGNQLTEDNDKRRRIEARNTGSNGRQCGGQKPRYSVRGDVNPIASRFSPALHRCYNCWLGLPLD